eukprot:6543862-Heterocapsa_arctica.AAC.1
MGPVHPGLGAKGTKLEATQATAGAPQGRARCGNCVQRHLEEVSSSLDQGRGGRGQDVGRNRGGGHR